MFLKFTGAKRLGRFPNSQGHLCGTSPLGKVMHDMGFNLIIATSFGTKGPVDDCGTDDNYQG